MPRFGLPHINSFLKDWCVQEPALRPRLMLTLGQLREDPYEVWHDACASYGPRVFSRRVGIPRHEPFAPLSDWLRQTRGPGAGRSWADEWGQLETYPFHQPLWEALLEERFVRRTEWPLLEEAPFEEARLDEALLQLLSDPHQETLCLLGQAEALPASTLGWIRRTRDLWARYRLSFILCAQLPIEISEDWTQLMEAAETQGTLWALPSGRPEAPPKAPDPWTAEEALSAWNLGSWTSAREAFSALETPPTLAAHKAWLQVIDGSWDQALASLQAAFSQLSGGTLRSSLHRVSGYAHLARGRADLAREEATQARRAASQTHNAEELFYADYLLFVIEDQSRVTTLENFRDFYKDLIRRAQRLSLPLHGLAVATNPFGLYAQYDDEIDRLHRAGLKKARAHRHWYRLAVAYQSLGIAQAVKGEFDKTLGFYRKSLDLREQLGIPRDLAYIHNGLGYYEMICGRTARAHKLYGKALEFLRGSNEFHEVGMTLYNLALSAAVARRPALALQYMDQLQSLLHAIQRKDLSLHSHFGLAALAGYCAASAGQRARAWSFQRQIQADNLEAHPANAEEPFFFALFQSLMLEVEDRPDEALAAWAAIEELIARAKQDITYLEGLYWHERAQAARRMQRKDLFDAACMKGLAWARQRRLDDDVSPFEASAWAQAPTAQDLKGQTLPYFALILEQARMQGHVSGLHRRMNEFRFLNRFQDLVHLAETQDQVAQTTVQSLYDNFPVLGVFYHELSSRGPRLLAAKSQGLEFSPRLRNQLPALAAMGDLWLSHAPETFQSQLPPDWARGPWAQWILAWGGQQRGHLLMVFDADPHRLYHQHHPIITLAAQQAAVAFQRCLQQVRILEQNEELQRKNLLLEKTSTTDALTGLGNRQALLRALANEWARLRRYGGSGTPLSLIFLYLNRHDAFTARFGPPLGDLLLTEAGQVLAKKLRDTDLLFLDAPRIFVALLPETPADGARDLASRLIQTLEAQDGFRTLVESRLGHTSPLAEEEVLGLIGGVADLTVPALRRQDPAEWLERAEAAFHRALDQGEGALRALDLNT